MTAVDTREVTLHELLVEVRALDEKVTALTEKFDQAYAQISHVAEMAAPAIEQISASPIMKLLGGGKSGR